MDFSVIIPLYNKERTIERSIKSVLSQTYKNFEIIIVDDGSTDKGLEILKSFDLSYIKVIRQPNSGVSVARNAGIIASKNEWIAFLDADDEWLPDYLSTIAQLHSQFPNCNVLATSYYLGTRDGCLKSIHLNGIKFNSKNGILKNYFEVASKSSPPIWTSAVVVNKTALRDISGFPVNVKLGEDLLTWAKLALNCNIAYCKKPLSIFWHDKITLNQIRSPEIVDFVGMSLQKLLANNNSKQKQQLKRYLCHWHKMRAHLYMINNENVNAKLEIRKALSFNKWNIKVRLFYLYVYLPKFIKTIIYNLLSEIDRTVVAK
jgi:glycosyltransferase involved in cell wall biosynthesis